jgi:hypothetical protein
MMRIALLSCLLAWASCTSDSEWCSLSGKWQGQWTSQSGLAGSLQSTLSQRGSDVTGTVAFGGSPCFDAADVSLVQAGQQISGSATAGAMRVDMGASWVEDHLEGTYTVISGGVCSGDTGTFQLDRN